MMGTACKAVQIHSPIIRAAALLFLSLVATSLAAATFVVTNTSDSGSGSLRQAILDAEDMPGPDRIEFSLPGTGPFTIALAAPLPSIRESVAIDGTTQPGYAGVPRIEISGAGAGANATGLYLLTSGCEIKGLCINRFSADGLRIEPYGSNVIQGCYIGTSVSGASEAANTQGGITIRSPGNIIGGTNQADRNVISGGNQGGIFLLDANAKYNQILGNYIGLDASGSNALGNLQNGIMISSATENFIGGPAPGAGNVISGNGQAGLYIAFAAAADNRVEGNLIGTDASGQLPRGNAVGVAIVGGTRTLLGGTEPGTRNVISGNASNGVQITLYSGTGGTSNLIQGNFIGTDLTGTKALPGGQRGVELYRAAHNTVGGGNVISGNAFEGIAITGGTSTNNRIVGNLIGTDRFGTNALPNGFDGIVLAGVSNNVVGGMTEAERNVISGNTQCGVFLAGPFTGNNSVQGNYVGTDLTGGMAVPNGFSGVHIEGADNRVGGDSSGTRNVISGNVLNGVYVCSLSASNNIIAGNVIGLDASGTNPLGNAVAGVGITSAPANQIGGATTGAGNVISANGDNGIYLQSTSAARNLIQGNLIGTDTSGRLPRGNALSGIYASNAPINRVGGPSAGERNVISANGRAGIRLRYAGTDGWTIQGNYIGTAADGESDLGNYEHGIELYAGSGASFHTIGGTAAGEGNRIAHALSAGFDGVRIRDGCTNNLVVGNVLFANGGSALNGLGIDLGVDGADLNDACDSDVGGNQLQNAPVLTNAFASATATSIRGTLNSTANRSYTLQFYASPAGETSSRGEGRIYLGQAAVRTAANCTTNFVANVPVGTPAGYVVNATTTDANNNTSELSQAIAVRPQPALLASNAPASRQLVISWTNSATGFELQSATNLSTPVFWSPVTNTPLLSGGRYVVSLPTTNGPRFYRLILP